MLDIIYISFIALSALTGLLLWNPSTPAPYKLLTVFLMITFLNESTCFILKKEGIRTHILYNTYYYIRFPLIGWMYYKLVYRNQFFSLFIRAFLTLSIGLFFLCLYLYDGFTKLHTVYLLAGGIFTIALCLMYLLSLLRNDEIINPFVTPFFWISTGFFFFFLGVLPYLGMINFLVKNYAIFAEQPLILVKLLSILLYSLISIDFLVQWKQTKFKYGFMPSA